MKQASMRSLLGVVGFLLLQTTAGWRALRTAGLLVCAWCVGTLALAQTPAASVPPVRVAMIEGLSGPFANTGEAVFRNLVWAIESVNARGERAVGGALEPPRVLSLSALPRLRLGASVQTVQHLFDLPQENALATLSLLRSQS